ncbi:MAG: 7-cyano-7-deazaguanine synthase QueC [Candidatus Omnitrophica bacterium]|nr:7-cyano-7-deazaguanine synthase QueC [Candidatus Omnitrophota bacterium]
MPVLPISRNKKAIVLLSGGLDSATVLYLARQEGFFCHCLSFAYGQRHRKELEYAQRLAREAHAPWEEVSFTLPWKGSALLEATASLPKHRSFQEMSHGIPPTYVPARNTLFLSFAASWAEAAEASFILIGANALDYSGYPDCRPEFFSSFNQMIGKGTKAGEKAIEVIAPLVHKTKAEIIQLGVTLRVPYELTWSCYEGGEFPCGSCDSCLLRAKGFREAGFEDPLCKLGSRHG